MVAKSFQSLEQVGEPYTAAGRQYVQVRTKSGTLKQVRWYTETEYKHMYPTERVPPSKDFKPQKEALGFTKGYITIFKGNTYEDRDYFKASAARYTRWWGWYFLSTDELPLDLPSDVEAIRLPWELVGKEDGSLKPEAEVIAAVQTLICDPDNSEYQGTVGERLEVFVTVEKTVKNDGYFGASTMHIMRDDMGNCYIWNTSTRSWPEGSEHHIVGTVKEHNLYRRTKQTVLTRCRELN